MQTTIKAQDLQIGDTFLSKGTKLKVARIKSSTENTVILFCLSYILSSYITVTLVKTNEVELL